MKTMKWVAAVCLGCWVLQGFAQVQVPPSTASVEDNAAAKERLIKSGKGSAREKAMLARAAMGETNLQAGASYLAVNKTKPGVVTLPSGVQYKVLKAGAGKRPTAGSAVRLRYLGSLVDGRQFDKLDEKKPVALQLAGLVPGLQEALKLMPLNAKWDVVIPPEMAYGAQGSKVVAPNAVLLYTVELVGID
jgi:FKBP-type peptidyl-prolyl cis-trans isomerase FklB